MNVFFLQKKNIYIYIHTNIYTYKSLNKNYYLKAFSKIKYISIDIFVANLKFFNLILKMFY